VKTIGHSVAGRRIAACAQRFAGVDERDLCALQTNELEAWLRTIEGIGDWSATFVLIRGFGRMERLRTIDDALLRAAREVYGCASLTADDVARRAKTYGDDAGLWAFYLRLAGERSVSQTASTTAETENSQVLRPNRSVKLAAVGPYCARSKYQAGRSAGNAISSRRYQRSCWQCEPYDAESISEVFFSAADLTSTPLSGANIA
jgi:hypothetical protein